ncbi:hypothetical protein L6452_03031 [Arctium lappa]|uniref:Uncharacterized protein n=1 Tax=Arctium lappa TaxID=4217 RepID=A0ACB9FLY1_ARCLA|nr:hypothetical protein L6452_03031 [Arctium lappa]
MEMKVTGEARSAMELQQEVGEATKQVDSNDAKNFEESHDQSTENENEINFRKEEDTWMEGSSRVRDGPNSSNSPKEDMDNGNQVRKVSETQGEKGGPGQIVIGEEDDPNQNKSSLKIPYESDLHLKNWNETIGTDKKKKEDKKDWKQSKGGQSKMKRMERQEADFNKTTMKKGDNLGMGRGKERRKKKLEDLCSLGSLVAISDELRSEESTSDVLEFGKQLGISWEGKKLEKGQTGTRR